MHRLSGRASALVVLVAALLVGAACGGGDGERSTTATDRRGLVSGTPDLSAVRLAVTPIAELSQPVALAVRLNDSAVYVAEKGGRVRRIANGQGVDEPSPERTPLLDLSGDVSRGGEQGLLGLAFSPDGNLLYVSYTDRSGDSRLVEYRFADGRVDTASRRVLLTVDQPFANHNGGQVSFGPDGLLYFGLGDGGSQEDPDRNGQDLSTPLAKILRIDPRPSGDGPYSVPPDNPFVDRQGARAETWVWGLRNPWRFSWDRQTGDLWIADVGEDEWEEVDFLPSGTAGANLGWSLMDSLHPLHGRNPPGGVLPIVEYPHQGRRCAVTGGYVYRGSRIPALRGVYLYADACSGELWGLVQSGGRALANRALDPGVRLGGVWSFGEDAAGELYLLTASSVVRLGPG